MGQVIAPFFYPFGGSPRPTGLAHFLSLYNKTQFIMETKSTLITKIITKIRRRKPAIVTLGYGIFYPKTPFCIYTSSSEYLRKVEKIQTTIDDVYVWVECANTDYISRININSLPKSALQEIVEKF